MRNPELSSKCFEDEGSISWNGRKFGRKIGLCTSCSDNKILKIRSSEKCGLSRLMSRCDDIESDMVVIVSLFLLVISDLLPIYHIRYSLSSGYCWRKSEVLASNVVLS